MADSIIQVKDVTMRFNLLQENINTLKEYLIKLVQGKLMYNEFTALRNISFDIARGESFGIVGTNGSGKSTLLKIISGIYAPTEGAITVNGRISPLIELGTGFDAELTATENVFLNGAILGHSRKFLKEHFDELVDFAELHDFMNVPIKNFSSGMIARLGFSIAILTRPEILIVDEILAVGDYAFQKKCEAKMQQIRSEGVTMLFVSHSIEQVRQICGRALWIDHGNPVMLGDAGQVCDAYIQSFQQ